MTPSTEPHPNTSTQSPITELHTSSPQLTKPPTSLTIRETIRQEVEIPQLNFPTQTLVADRAAFTRVDVVHGGAATIVSSIDAGYGSGNITKSPTMPYDSPLLGGHTPGSDKGSMTLHELTVLCTNLSNKVESMEIELKQTKQTYGAAFNKLIKKVKKLEQTVKTSQARRRTNIIASDDEEDLVIDDPSKQRMSKIEEMDLDTEISLVPLHVEVQGRYGHNLDTQEGFGAGPEVTAADAELNTASTFVSIASPQRHADTTANELTLAETLMEINKSVAKDKSKAKMDETESPRKMKQREQVQISRDAEVAQKLQEEVAADEDFVQELQVGEKCIEEDLPMKLVELVNQRKKFFAQQRDEAKRNKPMNPAQQKEYMPNYIKNQEGGYSIKQLKPLSFEQVKEIFETTMRKIGEASGSGKESTKMEKELSEKELQKLLVIVPVEEVYVEALQVKYPIIDWEVYSEDTKRYWKIIKVRNHTEAYQIFAKMLKKFDRDDLVKLWDLVKERFSTTEPTDDKEKELWYELKRLFKPDNDDTLWKLQRPLKFLLLVEETTAGED
ncbi:hypothetical protein Tco_1281745 [Tanacetum coccineum]